MCGRYYVEPESDMAELAELIAEAKRKSEEVKTGEVFPSDTAAVIANNRQLKPTVFPMRWGFERKGGADCFDRIETGGRDFHMRIYDGYRELAARWPERFEVVDASGTIDEIFSDLTARLKKRGVL